MSEDDDDDLEDYYSLVEEETATEDEFTMKKMKTMTTSTWSSLV